MVITRQPIVRALRILHWLAPLLHDGCPTVPDMGGVWDHVQRLDNRESGFAGRLLGHTPKGPEIWIWQATADAQRPFLRVQMCDYLETRLVDLIAQFRVFTRSSTC